MIRQRWVCYLIFVSIGALFYLAYNSQTGMLMWQNHIYSPVSHPNGTRLSDIHSFVFKGSNYLQLANSHNVCLITQMSLDYIYWLPFSGQHWAGALSVAVGLFEEDVVCLRNFIHYLEKCYPEVANNIAVHLVLPKGQDPSKTLSSIQNHYRNLCEIHPKQYLHSTCSMTSMTRWTKGDLLYPQNLLRNVARRACPAKNILNLDGDMIPIPNLAQQLQGFLMSSKCLKCAYVLPVYEVDENVAFPFDKKQLLEYEQRHRAQPYRIKAFAPNQNASNFPKWRRFTDTGNNITVSHQVTEYRFFYEPFYVALNTVPFHDERFVGYGFDRNSQVYEMVASGWSFHVLSPCFAVHWGLKEAGDRLPWQTEQIRINSLRWDKIKQEIDHKYNYHSFT